MEELNEFTAKDTEENYHRLRALCIVYVEHKLGCSDHVFFYEIVDDMIENLMIKADIFNRPRNSLYFWWEFVRRQGYRLINAYVNKEFEIYSLLEILEFDFGFDPKDFRQLTDRRLKDLVNTGTFYLLIPLILEYDKKLGERLQRQLHRFLKTSSTKALLSMYSQLSVVHLRELKSCESNVQNLWCRKTPSRRKRKN